MNQITDNLWITDIQGVREQSTDRFDRVITVCQDDVADNVGCVYHHFDLADGESDFYGGVCSYELFAEAVDVVVDALDVETKGVHDKAGRKQGEVITKGCEIVLVHCHAGQSRSAAVCIAAIGTLRPCTYARARNVVADARDIHPNEQLREFAKRYIRYNSDGPKVKGDLW